MRVFQGNIITCDEKNSVFEYLVEEDGRIIYVGDKLPASCTGNAEHVELGERALLPAFGDSHIHYSNWAVFNSTFDVRSAGNYDQIGSIIKRYAKKDRRAKVLFGYGHSMHSVEEGRLITRTELDQIIKDRPIYLVCYDGHSAVVNTAAIGLLPLSIRSLRGFDLESGQLFQEAFLEATDFISGQLSLPRLLKAIVKGFDTLALNGVGMVHTVEGIGYPRDRDVDLVRFMARGAQQQFRVYFQTMDVDKVLRRNLPRIGGCFECALDGCFGARDAALLEPYSNDAENKGVLFYSDDQVTDFAIRANREGLQIQLHCIGDAAVVQAVNALEKALKDTPRQDHRHTLIHACLIPDDYLHKIADLNIGIALQPGFLISPLEPVAYLSKILGERAAKSSPVKTMLEMGINVSGGSDGPVTHPNPIDGIYGACNNSNPQQSVSIAEALKMFTANVAYTSFDEDERGSLGRGKVADMVILDRNPLSMDPGDLQKIRVDELILSGAYYERGRSLAKSVISSLKNRSRIV